MANNIEVILSGKDAGFTDTLTKAAATLTSKNAEMINSLGNVSKAIGGAGTAAGAAGSEVAASASKYTQLSEASRNLAATQVLARAQIKELGAAIKAGSVDAIAGKAAILELQAAVKTVGAQYSAAARGVAAGAGEIVGSHSRMSVSSMMMMHSVRSAGDSFAAGLPPMMIFGEQIGRLGEAAAYSEGALGKFGAFMGGPWGIVVLAATAVVGTMISKMDLFGNKLDEEVDKLKKNADQTELTRQAKEEFGKTEDGVRQAILDQKAAIDKQIDGLKSEEVRTRDAAQSELARGIAIRKTTQALLEQAAAREAAANVGASTATNPDELNAAQGGAQYYSQRQRELSAALAANAAAIKAAEANLTNRQSFVDIEEGKRNASPTAQINKKYDDLINAARARAVAENKVGDALQRQITQYEQLRQKALEAAKPTKGSGQFGRDVNASQATTIAQDAGFRVTSATRSFAQQQYLYDHVRTAANPVAAPGTSAHERGNALDIAFGEGVNPASIKKAFTDAGVRLTKLLVESGHFHIEWGKAGMSPEEAARKAQAEQDKATRRAASFADAGANLDNQILAAKKSQAVDASGIARFAKQEVKVANDKFIADVEAKEKLGDLTKAQGNELIIKRAILSVLQSQKIVAEEKFRKDQEDLKIWAAANDNQIEILHLQEQFAVTQDERRIIQLQILADEKEYARKMAKAVLNDPQSDKEAKAKAQGTLDNLDTVYSLKTKAVNQNNESPLDRYIRENDPKLINERVNALVVNELESVRQGIDDAITSSLGIKDPFLKGIVDMFVQTVLINPIAEALRGAQSSSSGGLLGGGGLGGIVLSVGHLLGFANGTDNAPAGMAWVGERGPELVNFRGGEQVIPNHMINSAGSAIQVEIVDTTGLFVTRVNNQILSAAPSIAEAGSNVAQSRLAYRQSRSLAA